MIRRRRPVKCLITDEDEKSRSPERDAIRSQVIDALEAQEIKETGMKKISTTTAEAFRTVEELAIGLDLGTARAGTARWMKVEERC